MGGFKKTSTVPKVAHSAISGIHISIIMLRLRHPYFLNQGKNKVITWTYVILSRVVAKFSTTWVQSDLMSSILMNSNIYKETVITKDKRQVMILQRMGSYLKNGRVEKVVTIVV